MKKILHISIILLFSATMSLAGEDCLEKLQNSFSTSKLIAIKADLSVYSTVFEDTDEYNVNIFIADSGFYRVELDKDVYLFDGKKVWEYSYENKQATYRETAPGERPVDEISFIKNLDRFYESKVIKPCRIYELTRIDSTDEGLPDEMTLIFANDKLQRIEYKDLNGDLNTFKIKEIKLFNEFNQAPFKQDFPDSTEIIALP
jgi:outer membrane lipoprotein-sorting protein